MKRNPDETNKAWCERLMTTKAPLQVIYQAMFEMAGEEGKPNHS